MTITTTTAPGPTAETLDAWRKEVRQVNEANGWFESDRSLDDGIALLHTEVAEAVEAYRQWGLEDATYSMCGEPHGHAQTEHHLCKPEGVGSELADVLIRLLDETDRQDLPLDAFPLGWPIDVQGDGFTAHTNALHRAIGKAGVSPTGERFTIIYATLRETAAVFEVDLGYEYVRKVAFNATRGHRHGGKLL